MSGHPVQSKHIATDTSYHEEKGTRLVRHLWVQQIAYSTLGNNASSWKHRKVSALNGVQNRKALCSRSRLRCEQLCHLKHMSPRPYGTAGICGEERPLVEFTATSVESQCSPPAFKIRASATKHIPFIKQCLECSSIRVERKHKTTKHQVTS